jgi:phage-related holin
MFKYLRFLTIAVVSIFAPVQPMLYAALSLVMVDLFTGLLAARRRKEKITSQGLKRTVIKLLVYEFAIVLAYITERYLTQGILPIANIMSSFVGVTELKSVLENVNEISGGSLLSTIIQKLNPTENDQIISTGDDDTFDPHP